MLARAGHRAADIGAVGMASFASTLVGVDGDDRPLTPIYAYSDTRPAQQVRELRARLDEEAVHQRTGCRLHASYVPPRLLWLRQTRPEIYRRVRRWLSLPEFVYARILGHHRAGYSIAAWSGLLDRRTLAWDEHWLTELDITLDCLSPLGDAPFQGTRAEFASRWPALARVPWFPAYADGAASNIGSDCDGPDRMALSIGTSGAMRVVPDQPPEALPAGLWCYRVDQARPLVGGALNEGGGAIAWAARTYGIEDVGALQRAIADAEPAAHGLTVLPFLAGERSPGWNADMRAVVAGIGLHSGAEAMLQAWMEAVAYRFALIERDIRDAVTGCPEIIASGGGAVHAPVWLHMIADVLGRRVALSAEPEATSRGVAMLALQALGCPAGPIPRAGVVQTFEPRMERYERHREAMARQQDLYRRLSDWFTSPVSANGR
jgi:gluconokinase